MRIVLPGGSGQVGQVLARYFHSKDHEVVVLTRTPYAAPWKTVQWDGRTQGPWIEELEGSDAIIHLSGRSIQCRYTPENRRELLESRIVPAQLLGKALSQLQRPPAVWLNASAANLYPPTDTEANDEDSPIASDDDPSIPETWNFAVKLTKRWEEAFFAPEAPTTRKIALRTTLVMSPNENGVFSVLSRLTRLGLGGAQGSGRQFVSWMHELDYARAIEHLIERMDISGPINMAAPEPLPNRDFMRELRRAWHVPIGLPAYRWMLEIGSGLMRTETELILKSRRVVPSRLLQSGFQFDHPRWADAAHNLAEQARRQS